MPRTLDVRIVAKVAGGERSLRFRAWYESLLRSLELRPGERVKRLLRSVSRSGPHVTQRRTLAEFPNAAKRPEGLHVGSQSRGLLCFRSALEGKLAPETE